MPPGIGDETLDVIRYIKTSEFLVVTTPSKVAMGAVGKLLNILIELKKPVLGVIENMTMTESSFIEQTVSRVPVRYLGRIHFDETLEESIGNPDRLSETQAMKDLTVLLQKIDL